jgi:hypothetical protein
MVILSKQYISDQDHCSEPMLRHDIDPNKQKRHLGP